MKQFHFTTIDSTNSEARRLALKSPSFLDPGIVVTAETQTQGRGSHGRSWYSGSKGGLYYSFASRPSNFDLARCLDYVKGVGELVGSLVEEVTGLKAYLEFPNDVMLAGKKVGGILIESGVGSASSLPKYVVVGIGLNINQIRFPKNLVPIATSLRLQGKKKYDKSAFSNRLTEKLRSWNFKLSG